MSKTAFFFAGQGAQASGMGKSLYEMGGMAARVFEMAEKIRPGTMADCFEADAERLAQTEVTQPCVFVVDLAAACALFERGVRPDAVAGFSLGELAALAFAGAFVPAGGRPYTEGEEDTEKNGFARGFTAVCKRAEAMAEAGREKPGSGAVKGGMCAVLKLADADVEALCKRFTEAGHSGFYPVNYNCPGQLVVAGAAGEMEEFAAFVKENGGTARPLPVSGAFHSPYMAEAYETFGETLREMGLAQPVLPVYANLTARPYTAEATAILTEQMTSPVRWTELVQRMGRHGYGRFVEVGPGRTLTGFAKRILPEAQLASVQDSGSLGAFLETMAGQGGEPHPAKPRRAQAAT